MTHIYVTPGITELRCGHIWFTAQCDPNVAASQMTSKQEVYCDVANSGFFITVFCKEKGEKAHPPAVVTIASG